MIEPLQSDDALVQDIEVTSLEPGLHAWWLGQSGFLVAAGGRRALFDPYLSDTLTAKYANTAKPHTRLTRRCVAPEALGRVDVVTASHGHTDHLDPGTLGPLVAANPGITLLAPEAIRGLARERSGLEDSRIVGVDAGDTVTVAGLEFRAIPSAHNTLEIDDYGRHRFLGFIVKMGEYTIYHSGDTLLYDGLEEHLRRQRLDLAFLPINGNDPSRGVAGNLDGLEAARLASASGAGMVVPHHFEMFRFNTASPDAFRLECERLGQPYRVLRCGERITL